MPILFNRSCLFFASLAAALERAFLHFSQPVRYSIALSSAADIPRSRTQLIAENALLRQQLIILHRQINKPHFTPSERLWLVLLASRVQNWRNSFMILKPETLWRWHRLGFRLFWKFKSCNPGGRPRLSTDTIALIHPMTQHNALWGAERIRGELLTLDLRVATATIQKYLRQVRPPRAPHQAWSVFLNNHAQDVWACDFLPVIDLFFRQTHLFSIVELAS